MTAQRALPQSKEALLKSYTTRLKEDVKSMLENFEGTLSNLTLITLSVVKLMFFKEKVIFNYWMYP